MEKNKRLLVRRAKHPLQVAHFEVVEFLGDFENVKYITSDGDLQALARKMRSNLGFGSKKVRESDVAFFYGQERCSVIDKDNFGISFAPLTTDQIDTFESILLE